MVPRLKALAHKQLLAYMDSEQALDGMTREQLISLLYSILRRLLPVSQATTASTDPGPAGKAVDGGLVIDPTIDAWEHTGVYPQGFQPLLEGVDTLTISTRVQCLSLEV